MRLDLAHGGEIADLVELRTGRQLLAHTPFSTSGRPTGDVAEQIWTRGYRGGWQLLTPNAGSESVVGGVRHGFHGAAANESWTSRRSGADFVELEWQGHGLEVRREIRVDGTTVAIQTDWQATGARVPFVVVEHLALGPELLDPEFELTLSGGKAYELSETDGPLRAPEDATDWPRVRLMSGGVERADRWSFAQPRSRFMAVNTLAGGLATVWNAEGHLGVRLEWDAGVLPHAWIWHEVRATDEVWRCAAQLLMIEPASVPHSLGLAAAIDSGDAHWVGPGETVTSRVRATILFEEEGDP